MAKTLLATALSLGLTDAQSIGINNSTCANIGSIYNGFFSTTLINGTSLNLNAFAGEVLMITNVASF